VKVAWLRASALPLFAAAFAACGQAHVNGPGAVSPEDAIIKITSTVPEASLWVDGRYIGTIGAMHGGIAIAAGSHRLELRHDDYFSRYTELTVRAREHRALSLDLAPRLP
jgi:PEGA domain